MKKRVSEQNREIILEFLSLGNSVKVCAIDVVTGTEVSIVGPASAGQPTLERNAVAKLKYVMDKKKAGRSGRGAFA